MRSLRAFIISFVLSITIFGVLAYNIMGIAFKFEFKTPTLDDSTAQLEDGVKDPLRPTKPQNPGGEEDEEIENEPEVTVDLDDLELPPGKETQATFLFIGTDYQPSKLKYNKGGYDENGLYVKKRTVSADAIVLLKIDRAKQTFMISSIPSNTIMNKNTNKTIGELYSEKGASYMVDCVYALTGIQVEHLAVISVEDCEKALKKVGNITFDVPCNMYYEDKTQKLKIDLKSGVQSLTPKQAVEMLRFKDYPEEFIYTRESTLVDFSQALLEKLTSPAYLNRAVSLFKDVVGLFETNFDVTDFTDHLDLIYSYPKYQTMVVTYPGYEKDDNGDVLFVPSTGEALSAFEEYK